MHVAPPDDLPPPLDGLRLLVASHVRLYREGIAGILAAAGARVVALVAPVEPEVEAAAAAAAGESGPVVLLLDVTMPGALATMRRLGARCPAVRVVALGVSDEADDVVACAEAGAVGYVARESGAAELVAALRSAARGEVLCSPRVAAGLFRRLADRRAVPDAARRATASLTPREREVLALIDRGLSNKEIAARLHIGVTTVKNHVHRILEKLHAGGRGEAAALARGEVAVPLDADRAPAPFAAGAGAPR